MLLEAQYIADMPNIEFIPQLQFHAGMWFVTFFDDDKGKVASLCSSWVNELVCWIQNDVHQQSNFLQVICSCLRSIA